MTAHVTVIAAKTRAQKRSFSAKEAVKGLLQRRPRVELRDWNNF